MEAGHCSASIEKKPSLDPEKTENFRPICRLLFFAKVAEVHVIDQLMNFIEAEDLLHETQLGFHPEFSTEWAFLLASESLRQIVDGGKTAALFIPDLSAAFDTVSQGLLLERLYNNGVGESALLRIASFLQKHTIQVVQQPFFPEAVLLQPGVPLGSTLSPTLSNLYMHPFVDFIECHRFNIVSYVDDTQLIITLSQD
ncbi:hypothetical protein NDU88_001008 [Pleurodeles waltl]|uniref:Reverse transcriptase domain-containing protein n=1 Tax=Pleurodeles waltl TaxID=8319 RepID=A0AAV7LK51_PLEWA|nr:hypothetical protein NDU88_001008 [Pleurodeles waltl]